MYNTDIVAYELLADFLNNLKGAEFIQAVPHDTNCGLVVSYLVITRNRP